MFRGQSSTIGAETQKKGERKKQRVRACTECHRTKSKCIYPESERNKANPRCTRCIRLGIKCMPHVSRQGMKRKKPDDDGRGGENSSTSSSSRAPNKAASAGGGVNHNDPPASPFVTTGLGNVGKIKNNHGFNIGQSLSGIKNQGVNQLPVVSSHQSDSSNLKRMASSDSDSMNTFWSRTLSEIRGNNLTGNFSARDAMNNINRPSPNPGGQVTSSDLLKMLPIRSWGDSNALIGRVDGGSNAPNGNAAMKNGMSPLVGGGMPSQTMDLLRNTDPAKLNAIINHLANSNANDIQINGNTNHKRSNSSINGINALGNYGLENLNTHKLPPSSALDSNTVAAQQPQVSALLMLAGTSSRASAGNGAAMSKGNEFPANLSSGINDFRTHSGNHSNGTSASSSNTNNVMGGGLGGSSGGGTLVTGHNNSIGHTQPPQSPSPFPGEELARQEIGRMGNQNNIDNNTNSQSGIDTEFHNTGATVNESLLKKQKKETTNIDMPFPSQDSPTKSSINNNNALRRTSSNGTFSQASSGYNPDVTPEEVIGKHIGSACSKHSGQKPTDLRNHYGLQCQIREWISIALVRRSFALLGKASSLAHRCGIHMDWILCGAAESTAGGSPPSGPDGREEGEVAARGVGKRMNYLLATLLEPRSHQMVFADERRMLTPRLSQEFLNVVGCASCPSFADSDVGNRWIMIRETHKGVSRFYCSPAFDRNVIRWKHLSQIYEDNLVDVASLFLLKDAFLKLLACNAHQISLHSSGGMPPRPVHASKTKVRLLGRRWASNDGITKKMIEEVMGGGSANSEMEMDMRYVYLPRTDKTTHYLELFHHSENDGGGGLEPWTRSMTHDSANVRAVCDGAAGEQRSVVFPNNNEMNHDAANSSPVERNVSESPPKLEEPPSLHEVKNGQEFVGIDDILGNEDMDQLLTLLLD